MVAPTATDLPTMLGKRKSKYHHALTTTVSRIARLSGIWTAEHLGQICPVQLTAVRVTPREELRHVLLKAKKGRVGPPRKATQPRQACWSNIFSVVAVYRGNGRRCSLCGCRCVYLTCRTTRQWRPTRLVQEFPPFTTPLCNVNHFSQPCQSRQNVSR